MKCRDLITDYDGKTADTGRSLAVFLVAVMSALQAYATYHSPTHAFDAGTFGGGVAAILGALGIAIAGDNHRRPDHKEQHDPDDC